MKILKNLKNKLFLSTLLLCVSFNGFTQDSTVFNKKRLNTVIYTGGVTYGVGLIGLNALWYKNSSQTSFHFFNDNKQWHQVDKAGHGYTAYQLSRVGTEAFQWTGFSNDKAAFWGAMLGVIYQTPIEILDGFSSDYGASWGDLVANTTGASLFYFQEIAWQDQRFTLKYSFTRSPYASSRPNVLGSNIIEEGLKDYNGQTYWLSGNIHSFITSTNFPKWLNLAIGYGAEEFISALPDQNSNYNLSPYRQYYLALDIDLTKIETKSKALKTLFFAFNAIKIPLPAIEYNRNETAFHFFKF